MIFCGTQSTSTMACRGVASSHRVKSWCIVGCYTRSRLRDAFGYSRVERDAFGSSRLRDNAIVASSIRKRSKYMGSRLPGRLEAEELSGYCNILGIFIRYGAAHIGPKPCLIVPVSVQLSAQNTGRSLARMFIP